MNKEEIFKPGNLLENGWPEKRLVVLCLENPREYEDRMLINNAVTSSKFMIAFKALVLHNGGFSLFPHDDKKKPAIFSVDYGVGWKIAK